MVTKTTKSVSVDEKTDEAKKETIDVKSFVGERPAIDERPALDPSNYTMAENNYAYDRNIPDANLPTEFVQGVLDIANEGSGLLRPSFSTSTHDVYISSSQIRRFNLRVGDLIGGQARQPKDNERYWGLLKVEKVNGVLADELQNRPDFDTMTAIYPDKRIDLTTGAEPLTNRVIDLIAPIGFGQRGLIVSPPKAGKTWLLK